MWEFLQKLKQLQPESKNIVLTGLTGEALGEKALVSNGKLVWASVAGGFLEQHDQQIDIHQCVVHASAGNAHQQKILKAPAQRLLHGEHRVGIVLYRRQDNGLRRAFGPRVGVKVPDNEVGMGA